MTYQSPLDELKAKLASDPNPPTELLQFVQEYEEASEKALRDLRARQRQAREMRRP